MVAGVVINPDLGVPAIGLYASKKPVALHHIGAVILIVYEIDEVAVAKLFGKVGQLFRQDVGVHVDLQHGVKISNRMGKGGMALLRQRGCSMPKSPRSSNLVRDL